jgi:hypothetical protein
MSVFTLGVVVQHEHDQQQPPLDALVTVRSWEQIDQERLMTARPGPFERSGCLPTAPESAYLSE